jgi:hypothetical protein
MSHIVLWVYSLCKKTLITALSEISCFASSAQAFATCKPLVFKSLERLMSNAFLSKTENFVVFLLALCNLLLQTLEKRFLMSVIVQI